MSNSGTPDSSFNTSGTSGYTVKDSEPGGSNQNVDIPGIATHDNAAGGNDADLASAMTIDANGKILITGASKNADGNTDMVI